MKPFTRAGRAAFQEQRVKHAQQIQVQRIEVDLSHGPNLADAGAKSMMEFVQRAMHAFHLGDIICPTSPGSMVSLPLSAIWT